MDTSEEKEPIVCFERRGAVPEEAEPRNIVRPERTWDEVEDDAAMAIVAARELVEKMCSTKPSAKELNNDTSRWWKLK